MCFLKCLTTPLCICSNFQEKCSIYYFRTRENKLLSILNINILKICKYFFMAIIIGMKSMYWVFGCPAYSNEPQMNTDNFINLLVTFLCNNLNESVEAFSHMNKKISNLKNSVFTKNIRYSLRNDTF